jgi:hypothetical protein
VILQVSLASRYRTSTAEYVVPARETPVSRSRTTVPCPEIYGEEFVGARPTMNDSSP